MSKKIMFILLGFGIASSLFLGLNLCKEKNKEELESKIRLERVENIIEYFSSENSKGIDTEEDYVFLQILIFKINENDISEKDVVDIYLSQKKCNKE